YPALLARRYAGSYKSESKDSPAKKAARKKILEGILSDEFQSEFGFSLSLSEALKDRMVKDARGDLLDAVLCSLQAAWAWRQGKPGYGIPGRQKALLRSEGWIVDPSLNLEEAAPKLSGSDRGSTQKASENEAGNLLEKLKKLTDISLALSAERNLEVLLEMIMDKARELTHADGGTLYILEANKLHFKIFQNDTLGVRMGGESQSPLPFPPLEMNESNVSSYVAMTGHTVNIPDVKKHTAHNFSGPRLFDKKFKYKTRSMLLVPMKNQDEEIIGVIQLLNARKGPNSKSLIPFSHENVRWIQSLASQAAVAITHVSLVEEIRKTYSEVALARDMAMDANAAKSKFLANMTHELRTPMNAIIGYSEMLMEETLEQNLPEIHADLEKITRSAKMLLDLINDILDLSKIEAGKMDIHLESFKIQEVIDSSIHNIEPLANQNKNTLKIICPDNLGYMVADMTRVRQALINLLSNACKFTEGGQVALEVKRIQKDGTAWIFFSVSDTGIGIPQEKIRSIFSEFTQADSTITRKFGGTGLGLAISQRFCRMMGGHITADSEVNQGSTFTMK
ncbi:MAG: GAF domain-containing protein, partial [Nitrospinaceae bacterium]|nr:GAF domain-containing protein [Nitrospinaceae bacterium]NIR56527.1 GAF domain-containing protein [Nitrospinaceae bacterium]NIT83828.1 GAF domain-containing protein [Nitrospinaceae bacterium]NIX36187.1 GAF domain-containing protein [Nitrospinaceae bacterium]NIY17228.1 GAF domain-containing protein [Nitrospinaceae bacterium]